MARRKTTQDLRKKYYEQIRSIDPKSRDRAFQVFRKVGRTLSQTSKSNYSVGNMMQDGGKLFNSIGPAQIGKMIVFFYDPKNKDNPKKLPYYDRIPLIIPIGPAKGGFLGINFHYLHPMARAMLLDMLLQDQSYKWFQSPEEFYYDKFVRRRINMTYRKLQAVCKSQLFKPCVKHYLWEHCRSRFYMIDPCDWMIFLNLPVEEFVRRRKQNVWQDSTNKVIP